jgi:tRNA (guanine37-N1)-methyltransferase
MVFNILTIFPHIFDSYFKETIIKRAQNRGLISIRIFDIREFTTDKHRTVDDKPYGGGPGMILKLEPIYNCLSKIIQENKKIKRKIVLLSPKGKIFNQKIAKQFLNLQEITLICGRYEGIDERVAQYIADLEISIGNYILSGGELAAMIIVDTITRMIPGVIDSESLIEESFSQEREKRGSFLEYPQYTKPEIFKPPDPKIFKTDQKEWRIPSVLVSGNHQKIREWKEEKKEFRK